MTCANTSLPAYIRCSRDGFPRRVANLASAVQVGDKQNHEKVLSVLWLNSRPAENVGTLLMVEQRLYIPEPPAGLRACRNPTSTPCVLTTPSEVMRRSRCDSSRCLIASGSEDASMAKRRCTALETLLPYSQTQSAARSRRPVPAPQRSARHHRTVRRCGRSVHGALNFVAITGSRE